jgi:phosphoglycolate phosphatase
MPYKLAIFDFDGTLADSFPWVISVIDQVADEYHLPHVGKDDIEILRRMGARQIIKKYRVPFWKIFPVGQRFRRLMTENIHHIRTFDGVDVLFQELTEQGIALGVVTSNTKENVRRVLGAASADRLQYGEYSVSLFGKPGRLKKILRQSRVRPHEVIYIGDELRDIEAARKVRMHFGAVAWGYTHLDALLAHAPAEVFHSVEQITRITTHP